MAARPEAGSAPSPAAPPPPLLPSSRSPAPLLSMRAGSRPAPGLLSRQTLLLSRALGAGGCQGGTRTSGPSGREGGGRRGLLGPCWPAALDPPSVTFRRAAALVATLRRGLSGGRLSGPPCPCVRAAPSASSPCARVPPSSLYGVHAPSQGPDGGRAGAGRARTVRLGVGPVWARPALLLERLRTRRQAAASSGGGRPAAMEWTPSRHAASPRACGGRARADSSACWLAYV